jgi:hypothetical protein
MTSMIFQNTCVVVFVVAHKPVMFFINVLMIDD